MAVDQRSGHPYRDNPISIWMQKSLETLSQRYFPPLRVLLLLPDERRHTITLH
jgi:hypothetical protein